MDRKWEVSTASSTNVKLVSNAVDIPHWPTYLRTDPIYPPTGAASAFLAALA
jgi:hypothetical protein